MHRLRRQKVVGVFVRFSCRFISSKSKDLRRIPSWKARNIDMKQTQDYCSKPDSARMLILLSYVGELCSIRFRPEGVQDTHQDFDAPGTEHETFCTIV
jgi:hypothetical protein